MASVNKAIIVGRLGKDVELRYTPSGTAICNISVATSYKPKDKDEVTEWHRITLIDRLAEIASEYLKKGSLAYFEGRLQTRKWQDTDGKDNYTTEIVASSLQLLGGRDGEERKPAATRPQAPAPAPAQKPAASTGFDDMDDDIPF